MKYYHFKNKITTIGDFHEDDGFGNQFLNIDNHQPTYKKYISKF
jgi:hypothetical protein